ncbi:flippase-like domain-containing protein [Candidatus Saccharibacteria bacterium]|nr:flippase-like domain-containing protein [Candidatus Saccharibacteria bacterium]
MTQQRKKRGFRFYLNIITIIAVILLIWFARHNLAKAWSLLSQVNIWWLLLLVPLQITVYYSMSEIGMSYLERRKQMKKQRWWTKAIIALELNFVNHVLPSGGASGFSYGLWRMKGLGVETVHATMGQLVRTIISFVAFAPLLIVAAFWIAITDQGHGTIVMVATAASCALISSVIVGSYLMSSRKRTVNFVNWATKTVNRIVKKVTFGREKTILSPERMAEHANNFHGDFVGLIKDKKALRKPFVWGIILLLAEVSMFEVTFMAMGAFVDPMVLLLAYGASCVAGFVVFTPGGAGAYEATFILVLIANGVDGGVASAGTLLTRVILVIGTVATGYYFYHKAINRKNLAEQHLHRPRIKH